MTVEGLITIPSGFDPGQTVDRLVAEVEARGMTVFARIDHSAGASEVGLTLRPTVVLIVGNAKGGTPLMQAAQTIGIDLPLKVLVHQDADGSVFLSYNDPRWVARRHGIETELAANVEAMAAALDAITLKASRSA
jgi:uncharacterized protein (DUF302 family)